MGGEDSQFPSPAALQVADDVDTGRLMSASTHGSGEASGIRAGSCSRLEVSVAEQRTLAHLSLENKVTREKRAL